MKSNLLKLGKKTGKVLLVVVCAFFLALLAESTLFQTKALLYSHEAVTIHLAEEKEARVTSGEKLVELSEEEQESIRVERENARILAEWSGKEYVEKKDDTLVEKDDTMYRKIMETTVDVKLPEAFYIHKFELQIPLADDSSDNGYNLTFYRDGEVVNDSLYSSLDARIDAGVVCVNEKADSLTLVLLTKEAPEIDKVSMILKNDFAINPVRLLFMAVLFLTVYVLWRQKKAVEEKPELVFAFLSFLFGGLLIFGIGTNQVGYDEHTHAKTAYNLSYGTQIWSTETVLQMAGSNLPFFETQEERELVEAYEQKNHDYSWAARSSQSIFTRPETRVYYPMAAGFFVARNLHLDFAETVALAKLGNLLCYVAVMYIAIRNAKRYKMFLVVLGLLPNSIFLAAGLTWDCVVNVFLLLGVVLMTNEILEPERKLTWKSTIAILLSFIIGSVTKPIYIVMACMLLFFGKQKFWNRKQEILFKVAVLAIAGLMIYEIFFPITPPGSDYKLVNNLAYAGDKRAVGTSVLGQIKFILGNPLTYTWILLKNMGGMLARYLTGAGEFISYAYAGTASVIWTWIVAVLGTFTALFAPANEERRGIGTKFRILNVIMILGTSALVWTSMYVSYNAIGETSISGVQGRYFIPLFLPFFSCFFNNKWHARITKLNYNRIVFVIMAALNLFMTYTLVVTAMNA